jgi:hypothetical protein
VIKLKIFFLIFLFTFLLLGCTQENKDINEFNNLEENVSIGNESINENNLRCNRFNRQINEQELILLNEVQAYDTSDKMLNFINEFNIIERDDVMVSVLETYNKREGTKYDVLRLIHYILSENCYQRSFLVYTYDDIYNAVINFRDVDEPKYIYYDNIWKIEHHGWNYNDLLNNEEKRLNIKINKYGIVHEKEIFNHNNLSIQNVYEWEIR